MTTVPSVSSLALPSDAAVPLVVEMHDGWALLRIDRPEKRNALNQAARLALRDALHGLAGRARVVILTGTDGWFCCGADLKERAQRIADGQPDTAGEEGMDLAMALRGFPGVVIAAVNGLAVGYGVNLVNCADLALAADTARFGLPELRGGGFASMSAATSRLAGLTRKRLAWMVYGADPIDAVKAEAWGLVNHVVPASELAACAEALAVRIAAFDASALAETKEALARAPEAADWRAAMEAGQGVAARIRQRQAKAAR